MSAAAEGRGSSSGVGDQRPSSPATRSARARASTKPDKLTAGPKGFRVLPVDITLWKPDLSKCKVCDVRFTIFNHRHRCRKCQEPVCNPCSLSRKVLRAYTKPKRVCDPCVHKFWCPKPKANKAAEDPHKNKSQPGRLSLTLPAPEADGDQAHESEVTGPLSPRTPAVFFGNSVAATPREASPAMFLPPPTPADEEEVGATPRSERQSRAFFSDRHACTAEKTSASDASRAPSHASPNHICAIEGLAKHDVAQQQQEQQRCEFERSAGGGSKSAVETCGGRDTSTAAAPAAETCTVHHAPRQVNVLFVRERVVTLAPVLEESGADAVVRNGAKLAEESSPKEVPGVGSTKIGSKCGRVDAPCMSFAAGVGWCAFAIGAGLAIALAARHSNTGTTH